MEEAIKEFGGQILDLLKGSLKDLVDTEKGAIKNLLVTIAKDYAKEKILSLSAPEAERAEHLKNLEHLTAQSKGAVQRLKLAVAIQIESTIINVLEKVGEFVMKIGPKLIPGNLLGT